MMKNFKKGFLTAGLVASVALSGCASNPNAEVSDPFESYNRVVFGFNETVDAVALDPLTKAYRLGVPSPFRTGIANFLDNVKSPVYLVNELLQGDLDGAGLVTTRFFYNTFGGWGGLVDNAAYDGLDYEPEDFGQTLATWGVSSGPYIVMPLFGPSTIRDGFGMVVDMALDPINWYVWEQDKDDIGTIRTAATVMTTKDQLMDLQKDLRENSLDYYAATRSVWLQRRQVLINDGQVDNYEDF
jgi:phospholipid-binding lipoprotein MlaA